MTALRQKRSFEFEVETPFHLLFISVPAALCVAVQVLDCLRRKILGIECCVAPLFAVRTAARVISARVANRLPNRKPAALESPALAVSCAPAN
jgi:hypothetical protein